MEQRPDVEVPAGRSYSDQKSMLVGIVEFTENPQVVPVPSLVWLDSVDRINDRLPHPLYFSREIGLVFRGSKDREVNSPGVSSLASGEPQLERQLVEGAAQALNGVSGDQWNVNWRGFNTSHVVDQASRIRIALGADFVRVGLEEDAECHVEFSDMLFGPFDLRRTPVSLSGGIRLSFRVDNVQR